MDGWDLRPLVLAAGRGQRLRPLTDLCPKPLMPVLGRPSAEHSLRRLDDLGCDRCALNLHHLGHLVQERFGDHYRSMELTYSRESALLGTLGALGPLHDYFEGAEAALVINSDSLCPWPLEELVESHRSDEVAATLLVSTSADPTKFAGGVGLDDQDRIVSFYIGDGEEDKVVRRVVFAGAHVLPASTLARGLEVAAGGPSDFVRQLYRPLLDAGATLRAVTTPVSWYDLGTPRRYLEGLLGYLRDQPALVASGQTNWIFDPTASSFGDRSSGAAPGIDPDAKVERSVVEADTRVASKARIASSLLLTGCRVGAECNLDHVVVAPGVELPPATELDHCMVTSRRAGHEPRPEDTVVGDLILTAMADQE